jgi:aminoglycoside phosphotransferase (APT) family kinase protein
VKLAVRNGFLQKERDDEEFGCVSHGDLWQNNLMFRYSDKTGMLEDIWQVLLRSDLIHDLEYIKLRSNGIGL